MDAPFGVATDGANIFIADNGNDTVRKVTPDGTLLTVAGRANSPGFENGNRQNARFNGPTGICLDRHGNIYVAERNHVIRKIDTDGNVTTFAGRALQAGWEDGVGTEARFNGPRGLAMDVSGNIWVADAGNSVVRKISPEGEVQTIGGQPGVVGSTDGPAREALFRAPYGIAIDAAGDILITDIDNHTVRKLSITEGSVTTVAGAATVTGFQDGRSLEARFNKPAGIAVASNGLVYVTDSVNNNLRVIAAGRVFTVAGRTTAAAVDGVGLDAGLSNPLFLTLAPSGDLYIADTGNHTIRRATTDLYSPVRVRNGEVIAPVYYFGHWWEPWTSNDDRIREDFARFRRDGINTALVDHELSQANIANWGALDREHRLASEFGVQLVPWLTINCWAEITPERLPLFEEWFGTRDVRYGQNQDGSIAAPLIFQENILRAGAEYAVRYIDRYRDQALLKVDWEGQLRPVVALTVETGWGGGFDPESRELFQNWLRDVYSTNNLPWVLDYWGASPNLIRSWTDIDPKSTSLFNYSGYTSGNASIFQRRAVEAHVRFKSEVINQSMGEIARRVRAARPDILIAAELPYEFHAAHPDARAYLTYWGAGIDSCDYADILFLRSTGVLSETSAQEGRRKQAAGQSLVYCYRVNASWGDLAPNQSGRARTADLFATDGARNGNGFGFYSWNEMGDCPIAWTVESAASGWTSDRSDRAYEIVRQMLRRFHSLSESWFPGRSSGRIQTSPIGQSLALRVDGSFSRRYMVQSSSDLLNWRNHSVLMNLQEISFPINAGDAQRFFRLLRSGGEKTYEIPHVASSEMAAAVVSAFGMVRDDDFYWRPAVANVPGDITLQFEFAGETRRAYLQMVGDLALAVWNFGGGNQGSGSLWASRNGTDWVRILEAPVPPESTPTQDNSRGYFYAQELPPSVLGTRTIWLRAALYSQGIEPYFAQFLRNHGGVSPVLLLSAEY